MIDQYLLNGNGSNVFLWNQAEQSRELPLIEGTKAPKSVILKEISDGSVRGVGVGA